MERTCYNCNHYFHDWSVNASDCSVEEKLTDEEFEKHFGEDEPNCPHWEEVESYE